MDRSRYKFSRNEYLVAFVYMTFASGSHTSQQLEKITKFTIACSIHFDCRRPDSWAGYCALNKKKTFFRGTSIQVRIEFLK